MKITRKTTCRQQNLCLLLLLLLLDFTTILNILGHQRPYRHRAWKGWQILLRDSNFSLRFFYVPQKYDTGPTALLPFRRNSYSGFMLWKNPLTPAGIEPANLGSSGEYDNHGTTGVDSQIKSILFAIKLWIYSYWQWSNLSGSAISVKYTELSELVWKRQNILVHALSV